MVWTEWRPGFRKARESNSSGDAKDPHGSLTALVQVTALPRAG